MLQQAPDKLTPREAEMMRYDKEQAEAQMAYGLKMKELDIEAQKLDIKLVNLFRIPIIIIKLPIYIILAIAYVVHVITGKEPSDNFWSLLK